MRFNTLRLSPANGRLVANPALRPPVPLLSNLQALSDATRQSPALDAVAQTELARLTGLAPEDCVIGFESLGDNCEFGLVQRRTGAEPLSLLRFAGSQLHHIHRGLQTGFAGIDAPEKISLHLAEGVRREFMARQLTYDLVYHTFVFEGDTTADEVRVREATQLAFLQRKFLEDLQDGRKIFVVKRSQGLEEDEVLPIFLALNRHAQNTLLWVTAADGEHPPGTVERLYDRLFKGYLDRFAPGEEAADLAYPAWLSICTNAWALAHPESAAVDSARPPTA